MRWDRIAVLGLAVVLTVVGITVLLTRGSGQQAAVSRHGSTSTSAPAPDPTTSTTGRADHNHHGASRHHDDHGRGVAPPDR